jgi:hypothetical protein
MKMKCLIVCKEITMSTDISNKISVNVNTYGKQLWLALIVLLCISASVPAQSVPAPITDEALRQYALVMDSINDLTEQLKNRLTVLIKNNPKITEARYNQLVQLGSDHEKLKEAKATPEELAALQEINLKRTEETIKLSEVLKQLTTEKFGPAAYNAIRNAVKSDPEVKARYERILAEIRTKPKS